MTSRLTHLECARCGRAHDSEQLQNRCTCGGTLLARYDVDGLDARARSVRPPGMWRYRELLPVRSDPVCLGEVQTPFLFAATLSERWGVEVFIKDESALPTSTFKARGAACGLSRALELGAEVLVMPSAGNAGGAWALYAARANVSITVTIADDVPRSNRHEIVAAGAELIVVDGTLSDAARRAAEIAASTGAFLCATFAEPYRLEGKKSAWFEVFDQLGDGSLMGLPATVVVPVGGGVGAVATHKAATEVLNAGWAGGELPVIVGVQAAECAPLVRAFETGASEPQPWAGSCATVAAGLRVPGPSEGGLVLDAVRATGGLMVAVDEVEIIAAQADLAAAEGLYVCPEGAAAVAGAARLAAAGALTGPVVIYNTGAGAKYSELLAGAT